jgi:hypothetical protein
MNRKLNFFSGNAAGNPQLAHILMRCLAIKGPMSVEDLRRHVQPEGIINVGSAAWDATLNVLQGIGVVAEDDQVELLIDFDVPADGSIRPQDFRVAFSRQLVTHSHHAIDDDGEPSDLAQSLLWLSMLSGREVFGRHRDAQDDFVAKGFARNMIMNNDQWRPFIRWASALGVLRDFEYGYSVDLSWIIRVALMTGPTETSIQGLLTSLTSLIPLREDVTVGAWFDDRVGPTEQTGLTGAISMALVRLEYAGEIEMPPHDDAGGARALFGMNRTVNKIMKVVTDER